MLIPDCAPKFNVVLWCMVPQISPSTQYAYRILCFLSLLSLDDFPPRVFIYRSAASSASGLLTSEPRMATR